MVSDEQAGPWVSAEARAVLAEVLADSPPSSDVADLRRHYDAFSARQLDEALAHYSVTTRTEQLGGLSIHVVEPAGGPRDAGRLLCLHGGAFMWGSGAGALLEAVPVAAISGLQVVAPDYRLAPEHGFPAAVDDALSVYRTMLADSDGASIGVFGCSAGAILTAQLIARLIAADFPLPGAIAMLHGAGMEFAGDSMLSGNGTPPTFDSLPYFDGTDRNNPLVIPGNHPDVLTRFPPSLLVTSSRDFAASSVWTMHRKLLEAGVEAQCLTFDGLWHAHHMFTTLPESIETFAALAAFFAKTLRSA